MSQQLDAARTGVQQISEFLTGLNSVKPSEELQKIVDLLEKAQENDYILGFVMNAAAQGKKLRNRA